MKKVHSAIPKSATNLSNYVLGYNQSRGDH